MQTLTGSFDLFFLIFFFSAFFPDFFFFMKISLCPKVCVLFSKKPGPCSMDCCVLSFQASDPEEFNAGARRARGSA